MKKSEKSIIIGLLLAMAVTFAADVNWQAGQIRAQTLRLHIIARDDSRLNQNIKMQVKDVVADLRLWLYADATSYRDALAITQDHLEYIQQVTDNTLTNLEAGYTSRCSIEQFYFDTTEYDDFTMPRGRYTALTIRLGQANGKNWWCVVYPGLCAGIGSEYEDDTSNTFIETDNFRIKFKAVELWQNVRRLFVKNDTEKYTQVG